MKKVALEEHLIFPDFIKYSAPYYRHFDPKAIERILLKLSDVDSERIEEMDTSEIEIAVLSLTAPGIQSEPNRETAVLLAKRANELLAEQIEKRPKRFRGFAHLPLQDTAVAAEELERCIYEYKFLGALINGHTLGHYLDEEQYLPFWEKVAQLNVPIFIHPADSPALPLNLIGHEAINNAIWGWTVETATHALRLIYGGVFDRFPTLNIILGHMGETLPYLLWRLDSQTNLRQRLVKSKDGLKKRPSEYIKNNFVITTSGLFDVPPLICALNGLGEENVLFSVDYPYESMQLGASFIDNANISEETKMKVCYRNASRVLKIDTSSF